MAHKNAGDNRRLSGKSPSGEEKMPEDGQSDCAADQGRVQEDRAEITGRFVGVDETDRAPPNFSKIHILKTRSSSEQNLMLKTSSLRKGKFLSASFLYNKKECDKLNNNFSKDEFANKNEHSADDNKTSTGDDGKESKKDEKEIKANGDSAKDDKECKELCELIKAVSNSNAYKKNSNVYSVFQAKTLSQRKRSLPTLPKLIGQKLNEHGIKVMSKSTETGNDASMLANKDFRARTMRSLSRGIGRLLKRHSSVDISEPDPVFKVAYLGNVLTGWAKGEGCVDKPLSTLWRNYNQSSKPDVVMKLSITNSGLKGVTKEHGLTEYWAHRITFCSSPPDFPKVFCWVYRHEGRKLKHELRCHAVLCSKESTSKKIAAELQLKIQQALHEFKRDKISRQNARLSLANSVYENPSMPRRKILLSVGANNYKPPLERSKSAPKLMAIEEMCSEEDEEELSTFGERISNVWTKDNSPLKNCCKADDIFPSYTLGRRKCEKSKCVRKISLPDAGSETKNTPLQRHQSLEEAQFSNIEECKNGNCLGDCGMKLADNFERKTIMKALNEAYNRYSDIVPPHASNSTNRVSFSLSNNSEVSEADSDVNYVEIHTDNEDDNVFYCESDEHESSNDTLTEITANLDKSSNPMEQLCAQTNFMVLDSDEGSISSGCETASTVTSSDIEMTSLPCTFTSDYKGYPELPEKVSVLERVQSFEQLFIREKCSSVRGVRSSLSGGFHFNTCSGNFRSLESSTSSEVTASSPSDSACFSTSSDPTATDEVSLVPFGERSETSRRTLLRCSTFPPDEDVHEEVFEKGDYDDEAALGEDVCGSREPQTPDFDCDYKREADRTERDSDSACSVESGYSELCEAGSQNDCVIGNTVMV